MEEITETSGLDLKNVDINDAVLINVPTRPYDYADPDKYRLPLENDLIPYRFR